MDLDIVEADTVNPSPEFLKANPLAKIPTFVGSDGYTLTESMAIAIYSMYLILSRLNSYFIFPTPLPMASNDDLDIILTVIPI